MKSIKTNLLFTSCLLTSTALYTMQHQEPISSFTNFEPVRDSGAVAKLMKALVEMQSTQTGIAQKIPQLESIKSLLRNETVTLYKNREKYDISHFCKVLRLGTKIIGLACFTAHTIESQERAKAGTGSIALAIIDKEHQGRGYEIQLFRETIEQLKQMQLSKIFASEKSFNINPQILTDQLGFYVKNYQGTQIYKLRLTPKKPLP